MDQDLIEKVANLLKVTYSTLINQERSSAEHDLQSLSKDRTSYFQALLCIISSDMSHHTKNAAGLYLKKFVKECMENEYLMSEEVLNWGESIFTQLSSSNTEESLRANLGYALLPLLSLENPNNSLLSSIFPHILSGLQSTNHVAFGMLKMIQAIYSGFAHNNLLFQYFLRIVPELAGLVYRSLALNENSKWELLEETTCTLRCIIEHFSICCRSSLIEIQGMPELATVLRDLIQLDLADRNLEEGSLVHIATDELQVHYNNCKKQVFETINHLMEALISHAHKDDLFSLDSSPLLNMLSFELPFIVRSLELVVSRADKDELLQLEFISSPVKEFLTTLASLVPLQRFFYFFCQNFRNLAYSVCLPLLQVSQNDLEMFQDNPEEFVNESCDLCEMKESETFKCAAVNLLQIVCKCIDGALSDIWKTCYDLVLGAFENRQDMSENPLFNLSNEFRAELGLNVFAVLASEATGRLDLVQFVEEVIRVHLSNFYTAKFLVKTRLCMVIKYFSGFLFYNENNLFADLVNFLLSCCNNKENDSATVNAQASDALSSILQEDESLIRIFSFLPKVFVDLIEIIPFQNDKQFFQSIYEMVSTNISVIYPHVDKLVPSLVHKIIDVHLSQSQKKNRILIDYSWNIIQSILDSKKTQENEALELESYVLPLFEYLKTPKKLHFEDRILQFEVTLMKKCLNVSAAGWNLVDLLPHLQSKNNFCISHLFPFINTLIHVGRSDILQQPSRLVTLLERCEVCFLNSTSESDFAEACLLYQQMILTFKDALTNNFSLIIMMATSKLSPSYKKYLNSKLFGLVFACFASDPAATVSCLEQVYQRGVLEFVQVFYMHVDCVSCNYDLKIAVFGLGELLKLAGLAEVFQVIIFLLSPRRRDKIEPDKGEFTVKLKTKGFPSFDKEESELAIRVSTMFNDLSSFDEYQYFKALLQNMQNNAQLEFQRLIQSLQKDQVDDLTDIIKSKRVQLGTGLGSVTEIRKIVKAVVR